MNHKIDGSTLMRMCPLTPMQDVMHVSNGKEMNSDGAPIAFALHCIKCWRAGLTHCAKLHLDSFASHKRCFSVAKLVAIGTNY